MKLKLTPQVPKGYSATPTSGVIRTKLDGGASRYRTDLINTVAIVDVNWSLNEEQYAYLMAFYRSTIREGALSFTIDLAIYEAELKEYEVNIVPDSLSLTGQSGPNFFVTAQLEVSIDPVDTAAADAIVEAYNESH